MSFLQAEISASEEFSARLIWRCLNTLSSREEISHSQGKRNASKTVGVARGHQRATTLKPYSQKTSQPNHTKTTALSNSMKLSHACGATQDGRVMVERADRNVQVEVAQFYEDLQDLLELTPKKKMSFSL